MTTGAVKQGFDLLVDDVIGASWNAVRKVPLVRLAGANLHVYLRLCRVGPHHQLIPQISLRKRHPVVCGLDPFLALEPITAAFGWSLVFLRFGDTRH